MSTKTSLYIGLETKDKTPIEPQEVIDRISRYVDAGTFKEAKGLWNGELENSLVFECVDIEDHLINHDDVMDLKDELETVFNQESVMVETLEVDVAF